MIASEVEQILNTLAERFGTTVELLWEILVRQAYVDGLGNVVLSVVLGALIYLLYRLLRLALDGGDDDDDVRAAFLVFGTIGGVAATVVAISKLFTGIKMLLNPAYYALLDVVKAFGGGG